MLEGQEEQQCSGDKMLKVHKQTCASWCVPGVAWSRQLILGSMVLSSFQLNLKLADSGMAEMAGVGEVLRRGSGLPPEEISLFNSSALAFLSSVRVFPGKASQLVGCCVAAGCVLGK